MAAVASRQTARNTSSSTSSPRTTRASLQNPDSLKKEGPAPNESRIDPTIPAVNEPTDDDTAPANASKDAAALPANAPLAPPPKPNQQGNGDYFTGHHVHFSKELNPFENAFGNPSDTPGKPQLPGVTSLTSPASLLVSSTPGWPGSLRSGPLSPAMLAGPTGSSDYFNSDHHFAGSFPTPNESSLRTGLTPGGGGSMFPQPSPNSQAIYNSLQSGGATPGTLDFHRTAMTARAQNHGNSYNPLAPGQAASSTSQPHQNPNIQPDLDTKPYQPNANNQQDAQDPFSSHQTNDAANGLFMLAQAGGQRGSQQAYQMQQQQQQQHHHQQQHHQAPGQVQPPSQPQGFPHGAPGKRNNKGSIGSTMSGSTDGGEGQYSDDADAKPATKGGRGRKGGAKAGSNGKRKSEDAFGKAPAAKKQRGSNGAVASPSEQGEEDMLDDVDEIGTDGRKMTDEEKRKNFLERNRVAALKCRQRKKQWLANLQQKVEIFSTENDALAATVTQLREEIVGLKTLLLAHKECPVSQAQGISGMAMQQIAGDASSYSNPYNMMGPGMGQQGQMQQQQQQNGQMRAG